MYCYVTGLDGEQRSTIVREVEIDPMGITQSWPLDGIAADNSPGDGTFFDLKMAPGEARWRTLYYKPHAYGPIIAPDAVPSMHWTESLDFDVVLDGEIDILLETGPVRLNTGDSTVVTGVRHGWKSGPNGCLMLVLILNSTA